MKIKQGIGVSPGVAIAPSVVIDTEEFDIPQRHIEPDKTGAEYLRLDQAVKNAQNELSELKHQTDEKLGKDAASIFDFHLGLIRDSELNGRLRSTIEGNLVTAEFAVATVLRSYAKEFLSMPQYLADRVKDIYDIEKRLLRNLTGQKHQSLAHIKRDIVAIAHDLTPSQTAGMAREHVLGIAIDAGGKTSHTAIVAKAIGIPAVVGLNNATADIVPGQCVIIDGTEGLIVIDPDEVTLDKYRLLAAKQVEFVHRLDEIRELSAVTKDGHEVRLLGNIEFPEESQKVLAKGGEGIGLYRTEFLYLGDNPNPTEQDHYQAYLKVIEACGHRPVVIRTFDLGADKVTQDSMQEPERNPFLGCRSIRYSLRHVDMFKTQLRAILRAGFESKISILFPLITNIIEFRQAKAIVRDVMEDLEEEGIAHGQSLPIGMMVETPSAALQIKRFAKEADFFSIGTNDLVQYTLAVDRGNEKIASLYTAANPGVLKLIRQIIRAGEQYDVPVTMCGEMAGDPVFTMLLLGFGLATFSCSPLSIPEIKKTVRSVTMKQSRKVARRVMQLDSDTEIMSYLRNQARGILR